MSGHVTAVTGSDQAAAQADDAAAGEAPRAETQPPERREPEPPRQPRRRRRWPHVLGVGFVFSAYTALYSAYLLGLYAVLQPGLADVGEYDQAISGYAHFMGPHSPFVGLPSLSSAGSLQLSDHFEPLIALLAPGYWIHDGPQTLLVETAILCALTVIPLWFFTRRAAGWDSRFGIAAAYLVVIGYGVTWPLQMAMDFEFHEVFLFLPIAVWMMERAQAGRLRQAALVSLLLLGVKDDMGLVVAVFGVYLAAKGKSLGDWYRLLRGAVRERRIPMQALLRADRLWFLALVPVGLGMVELVSSVLIPHFGGSPQRDFSYTQFGATPPQAIGAMLGDPGRALGTLVDSHFKIQTLQMLLWPALGLCVFSPLSLMAAPLLLERYLSVNTLYWGMPLHYNAFIVPFIFCGGVDGALRVARWITENRAAAARLGRHAPRARSVLMCCFAAYVAIYGWSTAHRYYFDAMTKPAFWNTSTPEIEAARATVAHVPPNVLVAAATQIGPQLLDKDKVIMWSVPGDRGYPDTPWIVADIYRPSYPFPTVVSQEKRVLGEMADGYKVVFVDDGWVVLHKS